MISKEKQYRTRDGREVRIYATDHQGAYPVSGAVKYGDGWSAYSWGDKGTTAASPCSNDIFEVKPRIKREVWLHIFNNGHIIVKEHPAETEIDHRIACVKVVIDCEEGEGL